MDNPITGFVGLDVHAESTAISFAEAGRAKPRFIGTVGAKRTTLTRALSQLGKPASLLIVYEAGPCGYTLARELAEQGYRCDVVAPAKIPRVSGDRVKTDRRDALQLANLARAGALVPIAVPDARDEAIRDLSRARVDAVRARLKARQQLKALLLRHGRRYSGKTSWTAAHERYLAELTCDHPAQTITFVEYRQAVAECHTRIARLNQALEQQVEQWRMRPVVYALMTLRGLDLIAATTIVSELGDLRRFPRARELMSYVGLVPSEHSSGTQRRLGAITKTGNSHARRVLIEAAWNYRFPARISRALQIRQEHQSAEIRAIAWQAQLRLSHRYRSLNTRGLQQNKLCVAIARELLGFVWDIGQHITPED